MVKTSSSIGKYIPYDVLIVGFDYNIESTYTGAFQITRNGSVIATIDHSATTNKFLNLNVLFNGNGVLAVKDSGNIKGNRNTITNVYYRRIIRDV